MLFTELKALPAFVDAEFRMLILLFKSKFSKISGLIFFAFKESGYLYKSLLAGNINHDPTTDIGTYWTKVDTDSINSMPNLVINPDFNIDQRSGDYTSISSLSYTYDCWRLNPYAGGSAGGTVSLTKTANNTLLLKNLTGSFDSVNLDIFIENKDGKLLDSDITLSFKARSNAANNPRCFLYNGITIVGSVSLGDTLEEYTITRQATWDTYSQVGFTLYSPEVG